MLAKERDVFPYFLIIEGKVERMKDKVTMFEISGDKYAISKKEDSVEA